jgi:hypothetical protein
MIRLLNNTLETALILIQIYHKDVWGSGGTPTAPYNLISALDACAYLILHEVTIPTNYILENKHLQDQVWEGMVTTTETSSTKCVCPGATATDYPSVCAHINPLTPNDL